MNQWFYTLISFLYFSPQFHILIILASIPHKGLIPIKLIFKKYSYVYITQTLIKAAQIKNLILQIIANTVDPKNTPLDFQNLLTHNIIWVNKLKFVCSYANVQVNTNTFCSDFPKSN